MIAMEEEKKKSSQSRMQFTHVETFTSGVMAVITAWLHGHLNCMCQRAPQSDWYNNIIVQTEEHEYSYMTLA